MEIHKEFREVSINGRNAYIAITMDLFLNRNYSKIYNSIEWQYLKNILWLYIGANSNSALYNIFEILLQYFYGINNIGLNIVKLEMMGKSINDVEVIEKFKLEILEDNRDFFVLQNKDEKFFTFYKCMDMEVRKLFHDFLEMLLCEYAIGEPSGANNLYIMEVIINYMKEKGFNAFPNTEPFKQFSINEWSGWGNPISRKYIKEAVAQN
ncbi:MAG: hypothetical protein IPJ22_08315 [Bacteroidetes bacterium]|nr:hypothetical protein [Bacteroidota bacterium]